MKGNFLYGTPYENPFGSIKTQRERLKERVTKEQRRAS